MMTVRSSGELGHDNQELTERLAKSSIGRHYTIKNVLLHIPVASGVNPSFCGTARANLDYLLIIAGMASRTCLSR